MNEKTFLIFEADGHSLKIEASINHSPYGGPVAVPFRIIHDPLDNPEFMGSIHAFPIAMDVNGITNPKKRYKITIEEFQSLESTVREKDGND